MTKQTLQTILSIIAMLLLIDFLGYTMWTASHQKPIDSFYIGSITQHIINLKK